MIPFTPYQYYNVFISIVFPCQWADDANPSRKLIRQYNDGDSRYVPEDLIAKPELFCLTED